MKYNYEIITRESKFIIEEFFIEEIIARHSLNKIIRIKNNPNDMYFHGDMSFHDMSFQKESLLRTLKWTERNHPELLL